MSKERYSTNKAENGAKVADHAANWQEKKKREREKGHFLPLKRTQIQKGVGIKPSVNQYVIIKESF